MDESDNDILAQYGAVNNSSGLGNNATFRERIAKRFRPSDFVRVINIDNNRFQWVYADPSGEVVDSPDKYTRHVQHPKPMVYSLDPGESRVIPGHNAYVMVEALYKHYLQSHNTKIAAISSDPTTQERYISQIVVGVEDPMALMNAMPSNKSEVNTQVDNDLGLTDEKYAPRARKS